MCLVQQFRSVMGVVGVMANFWPFSRRDFSTADRGLLDNL